MKAPTLLKAGIYIRVSTDKESQETSLEYQELACRAFAESNGFEVYNVYQDVFTGTKSGRYNKRDGYNKLVKDALSKNIDVIMVKDLSRLSRNSLELEYLRDHVVAKNFHIVTLNGDIDSIKGHISLFSTYILIYSEESKIISLRTKLSKKAMAKSGLFIGSIPPYGYCCIEGKLYIRDGESPKVVQRIFNDYISGKSAEDIAKNLTEENIVTPSQLSNKKNASHKWHASTIRKILVNQHYIGNLVQGKTEAVNTVYKNRVNNSKDDYIVVEKTHEPIISEEQFNLVQDIIKSRKPNTKVSRKTHLFSNLIYCETCGKAMSPRNNYYICSGRLKYSKSFCCTEKINKNNLLHKLNEDIINKIDNSEPDFLLNYIEKKLNKNINRCKSTLMNLNTEKSKTKNKKNKLLDLLLEGIISKDEYKKYTKEYDDKINTISKEINSIKAMLNAKNKINLSRDFDLIKSKITKSLSLNPQILNYFIKRIEITKLGETKIYYRF